MEIRRARDDEAAALSAIARASKAYWPYPAAQIEAWLPDLTLSAQELASNPAWLAEVGGPIAGFFQLVPEGETAVLEHLWVLPQYMGRGIGRALMNHAMKCALESGARRISIDADPYAEAFYAACSAETIGKTAAPIPGMPERVRPQMRLLLGK